MYQVILSRDEAAEDGYAYEADGNDAPLQLCSDDFYIEELIKEQMPDNCQELYVADMTLQNNEYSLAGEPRPLCSLMGGKAQKACWDCPKC